MKKGIALIALLVAAVTATYAERVLEESFDYVPGETLDGKGEWSSSTGRKLDITKDSLKLKYGKLMTAGHKISIDCDVNANSGVYTKTFAPITLSAAGDTVYFSFLMNVRNTGSDDASIKIDLGAISVAATSNDESPRGIYPKTIVSGPTVPMADGTHLIVGKFLRDSFDVQYGQLFLWVDPDPSSFGKNEPGEANSRTKNKPLGSDTWSIETLSLSLDGYFMTGSPGKYTADLDLDEFRIGTTWADVTPLPVKTGRKYLSLGALILVLACVAKKQN